MPSFRYKDRKTETLSSHIGETLSRDYPESEVL